MRTYYISNNHTQEGPFTYSELREKSLTKASLVWHCELDNWRPAIEVPEVADLVESSITPPPIPNTPTKFADGPPPPSFDKEPISNHNHFSSQSYSPPAPAQAKRINVRKVVVIAVVGVAVFMLAYNWYMNNIYYPRVQAETVAFEESVKRKEAEELERKAEERRKYIRNNFTNFIVPQRSSYTYREIGGIEDLSITLHNLSEYRLDKVVVTVEYIKTNGGVYKTEELIFNGIKAKSETTLKAPDSGRGTEVNCYVTYILSKKLNMEYNYYTGSIHRRADGDPFRLR